MGKLSFPKLSEPIKIRSLILKNRMIAAPMGSLLASEHGYVTQEMKELYRIRARGGFSLVVIEACAVREEGYIGGRMLRNGDEKAIMGLAELADIIHEWDSKASLQLLYAGGVADSRWTGAAALTPSGISLRRVTKAKELTGDQVEELLDAYAAAADRTKRAGFDMVMIHMAHGVIPWQFMSPSTNKRKDKWGEPTAFPVEVIKRVRQAVGNLPIAIRIDGDDFANTVNQETMLKYAPILEAAGADLIDVSAGLVTGDLIYDGWFIQPLYKPRGCIVYLAEEIKKVVKVPVVTAGRLCDPSLCEDIVAKGRADIVALGRVAYADPEFPKKVVEGRPDDIRKCCACDHCTRMTFAGLPARCAVNYQVGHLPWEYEIIPAEKQKKVMVVGGGVGGMEAARVASLRGHKVTLYEKDAELGGAMAHVASALPRLNTRDLRNMARWQIHEMERLGIDVQLNKEVTAGLVARESPDVVWVATGSGPLIPKIPGINKAKVITNEDYVKGKPVGNEIVILGGGYGLETAVSLDREGKKVTIVEESNREGRAPYLIPRVIELRKYLKESGVKVLTETRAKEITDEGVVVVGKGGAEQLIKADTVIIAVGRVPNNKLVQELQGKVPEVYDIGDCHEPSHMMNAIHMANRLGRRV